MAGCRIDAAIRVHVPEQEPHGPPGRRIGNYIALQVDGKMRLAAGLPPAHGTGAPAGARPAGDLIRLDRGRDFGAYSFPSGTAGKLSGRP